MWRRMTTHDPYTFWCRKRTNAPGVEFAFTTDGTEPGADAKTYSRVQLGQIIPKEAMAELQNEYFRTYVL